MARSPWDPEPRYVTRALAALRRGTVGEQREVARRVLLRLMGHDPRAYPSGQRPSHFGPTRLPPGEEADAAVVAYDLLLELGYDAAADLLGAGHYRGGPIFPRDSDYYGRARDALGNLESGPPSMYLDGWLVFKRPIYKVGDDELIAKSVSDHSYPWYRFSIGKPVYSSRGDRIGWDPDAGHTFRRRAKTLKEAREL